MLSRYLRFILCALILVSALSCIPCRRVRPYRPPLSFDPQELPEAQVGQPYTATIQVLDAQTPVGNIYVDGELPEGLTFSDELDQEQATISGTPQTSGTFDISIGAWCLGTSVNGQTGTIEYQLTVTE